MQRIVNGVAQHVLGACRCPHCNGPTGGAVRGYVRGAFNVRPRYMVSSTFWLSGIFAAGASFDAKRKTERREEWDRAIAHVSDELNMQKSTIAERKHSMTEQEEMEEAHSLAQYESMLDEHNSQPVIVGAGINYKPQTGDHHGDVTLAAHQSPTAYIRQLEDEITSESPVICEDIRTSIVDENAKRVMQHDSLPTVEYSLQIVAETSIPSNPPVDHNSKALGDDKATLERPVNDEYRQEFSHLPIGSLLAQLSEQEDWPPNTGVPLNQRLLQSNSIYLTEQYPWHERTTWSAKKFALVETATHLLQLGLVKQIRRKNEVIMTLSVPLPPLYEHLAQYSDSTLDSIIEEYERELWRLKQSPADLEGFERICPEIGLQRYAHLYTQDGTQDGTKATSPVEMNQELVKIFTSNMRAGEWQKRFVLSEVAQVLGSSHYPPDLHTYNILLAGFTDIGNMEMTRQTIRNFRRSMIRPNEATITTILLFHIADNNRYRFQQWYETILGEHDGLCLSRSSMGERRRSSQLKRTIEKPGVPGKLIQLPYQNPKVLEAIIRGTLYFDGLEAALDRCHKLVTRDWGIAMGALAPLIQECAWRKDAAKGKQFWEMACSLALQTDKFEARLGMTVDPIPRTTIGAMLHLCSRTNDTEQYRKVMQYVNWVRPGELDVILSEYESGLQTMRRKVKSEYSHEEDAIDRTGAYNWRRLNWKPRQHQATSLTSRNSAQQ